MGKRTLYFIALLFLLINCKTENGKKYSIIGTMEHKDIDTVFMYDFVTEKTIDSIAVTDGKFEFAGTVKEPKRVVLGNFKKGLTFNLILDNDNYKIDFVENGAEVKAGKVHTTIYGFYGTKEYAKLYEKYLQAMDLVVHNKTPEKAKELEAKAESASEELFQYECAAYRKVIEGDYPINEKLFALSSTYDWENYPIEKQLKMLDEYEKEIGKTPLIEKHRAYLTAPEVLPNQDNRVVPAVGEMYKEIVSFKGEEQVKLSEVLAKNEYVILEFWASWCMPCRNEIPNLKKAYKKYKAKGLEILSVSLDGNPKDWLQAHKEDNTSWINTIGEKEFNSKCAIDYGVTAIPSSFLISKDGKIVAKNAQLRGAMLDLKLSEFLK